MTKRVKKGSGSERSGTGKERLPYWNAERAVRKGIDVINIYDGPAIFLETFGRVRREIGLLYATAFCADEICNGGLQQFFGNSTGILAPEAVEGFIAIGQPQLAGIVRKAMEKLPSPYPRERLARERALARLPKNIFDELNEQFYELIFTEAGGHSPASEQYAVSNKIFSKKKK